ncbi:MAG: chaperonin GroEL [Candidatus Brocadiales bacterium]|nr:chaperonin GroEL [Candidatus Bathyanammoxibius amoris]
MAVKKIFYGEDASGIISSGVSKISQAVKITLGPGGRDVIIEKSFGSPTVTKDGVTVAKEIELEDPYEDMGAKMIKEVASKTNDVAGDGTTTATVIAEAVLLEGLKNKTAGANPMSIRRGIEKAVEKVTQELHKMSVPVAGKKEIAQVATVAANSDEEIGAHVANAVERVGKDGVITVEEGSGIETTMDMVEGMQFDKGYLSAYFITDGDTQEVVFENPLILVHEKKLSQIKELVPLLEKVVQAGKPFLIIAEDVADEALATLVVNKLRGTLNIAAVKAPGFGEKRRAMLGDIAALIGANPIFEDLGIELAKVDLSYLGSAKKVIIDKENTTIIKGRGSKENIDGRIQQIRAEMEATTSDYDKEKLQERLAKLSSGVAVLNVGAATEVEMKEKKARMEDAIQATKAAQEEGILPGGGVALLRAAKVLDKLELAGDEGTGRDIVKKALEAPIKQLATNAGFDGEVVLYKVKEAKDGRGFDVVRGEYTDMIKRGIIDPAKVVRTAVQNGASIAALLLTTDALVGEVPEEKPPAPMPGGMGGMGGGMPGMGGMGGMGGGMPGMGGMGGMGGMPM